MPNPSTSQSEKQRDELFEVAVEFVLKHEGGLAENPNDPGGITKYGISHRAYPNLTPDQIRNLTKEQAKEIYKRDYWLPHRFYLIPSPRLAVKAFDLGVNIGPRMSIRLLQQSIRQLGFFIDIDGIIGMQTVSALNKANPQEVLDAFLRHGTAYYQNLVQLNPKLKVFLRGWLLRLRDMPNLPL